MQFAGDQACRAQCGVDHRAIVRDRSDGDVQLVAEQDRAAHARMVAQQVARGACRLDLHHQHLAVQRTLQPLRRVERQQLALVQQRDAIEALGFVHVGRADDHGDALRHHVVHDQPQVAARDRVDAKGRLVEQQDLRLVDQRTRQAELLLHAARQLAGQPVLERRKIGKFKQALHARRTLGLRHLVQVGVEVQVLEHRHVGVQAEALRHVGDDVLHAFRVTRHADAAERRVAGRRTQHAGQHAQRRCLAGAVGADQAEQLAARHIEAQRIHRGDLAEAARQALDVDRCAGWIGRGGGGGCVHCGASSSRTSAGMPGLSSRAGSPTTRTLTA